jgi:predicted MFS family arabinose efflux permease
MSVAHQPNSSWTPLVVIAITQILLAFNIIALKMSIDAIVASYEAPASAVKTSIVAYSLAVASCVMVGARIAFRFGSRRVFRTTMALFATAMLVIVISRDALTMVLAQMLAGIAAAALAPTSALLIADNYTGEQRIQALSWLSAVRSLSLAPAFLLAGIFATWSHWRGAFVMLLALAAAAFWLGDRLSFGSRHSDIQIDAAGFVLVILAVLLIGIGFDNLAGWGAIRARSTAPFSIGTLSPAPFAIVTGAILLKALVVWSRHCRAGGRAVLIAPEVIADARERSVLFSIFTVGAVSAAVTFLIPLYIEVVQGRSSLHTALAMIPFTLASVGAAVWVGRVRADSVLRTVARYGFLIVAIGLALLGTSIRNDWSDLSVIVSMSIVGLGEGALATLLLRLLTTDAPYEHSGDVEPLCSAASHLAVADGTAFAGALVIGILGAMVQRELSANPQVAEGLREHLNLDGVAFVSNDRLLEILESASAQPEHISEAVRINTDVRLRALKISFFTLAGCALLAFIPGVRVVRRDFRLRTRVDERARPRPSGQQE